MTCATHKCCSYPYGTSHTAKPKLSHKGCRVGLFIASCKLHACAVATKTMPRKPMEHAASTSRALPISSMTWWGEVVQLDATGKQQSRLVRLLAVDCWGDGIVTLIEMHMSRFKNVLTCKTSSNFIKASSCAYKWSKSKSSWNRIFSGHLVERTSWKYPRLLKAFANIPPAQFCGHLAFSSNLSIGTFEAFEVSKEVTKKQQWQETDLWPKTSNKNKNNMQKILQFITIQNKTTKLRVFLSPF